MLARPTPDPCEGVEAPAESFLTPQRREALAARFAAASSSASWEALEPLFDRRIAAWAQQRREACEATRVHGTQSDEGLDLRMQCLDRRSDELEVLLRTYDTLEPGGSWRALQAFDRLPSPEVCAEQPCTT